MTLLQPFYFGRNHAGASLDTAVIAVGGGMSVGDRVPRSSSNWPVSAWSARQLPLRANTQSPPFFDNLPGDVTLAIERVGGHDPAFA
jgi:hypothetical protein